MARAKKKEGKKRNKDSRSWDYLTYHQPCNIAQITRSLGTFTNICNCSNNKPNQSKRSKHMELKILSGDTYGGFNFLLLFLRQLVFKVSVNTNHHNKSCKKKYVNPWELPGFLYKLAIKRVLNLMLFTMQTLGFDY